MALVGSNGAGKSTLLKAIAGLLHPSSGQILFMGEELGQAQHQAPGRQGIVLVPEGRRLFQTLTVLENLRLGAYLPRARASYDESLERVFGLFPVLKEQGERQGRSSERRRAADAGHRAGRHGAPEARAGR